MKTPAEKKRIREMLAAEGLAPDRRAEKDPSWASFKKQIEGEFLAVKVPSLEIVSRERPSWFDLRWLVPTFAVFMLSVGVFLFRNVLTTDENVTINKVHEAQVPVARAMRKGDIFKSENREIRFLGGNATLTETNGKIRIETTALKADFRLRQKVDMQIEHPLVTVTITGTEFTLDASAKRGTINLTEGRLRIDLKSESGAKPVLLVAPVRFDFSDASHHIKKVEPKDDRALYRYELQNGEVFFAHQISRDARMHKVEILGGKALEIAAEDILRVAPVMP